jgi:hypothetical protein
MNSELPDEAKDYEDALRDLFAGLAMVAVLALDRGGHCTPEVVATASYQQAKAMMAERKKRHASQQDQ